MWKVVENKAKINDIEILFIYSFVRTGGVLSQYTETSTGSSSGSEKVKTSLTVYIEKEM